jgi:hypothetical protein
MVSMILLEELKVEVIQSLENYTEMSAISKFKICARMNQSLIPPFKGAGIVKTILKARYCVKCHTKSWQIVYCVYSIAQLGTNWAK